MGTHPAPDTFHLLIVTDEKDKTPEHEILNKIETSCKSLISVCAIVHKSDAFLRGLDEGSRFFTNALAKSKITYHSADLVLPELQQIDDKIIRTQAEAHWKRWGKNFLDAALNSYDEGNYNLSVFLMHQAVKSTLSAVIRVCLGYRLAIHNLGRQLRITVIFTDDLKNVFDTDSVEDMQLFELLQNAYSAARCKDDFNPDIEIVKALSDKVCKLFITAEGLYEKAIDTLKD